MAKKTQKTINLALQGGGSHGAYTWGVLERILEEEDIAIEAISGTSAGAMNAAVLVNGFVKDGRAGAIANLRRFWEITSHYSSVFSPIQQNPIEQMQGWGLDNNLSYNFYDMLSRMFSPYELNPMNFNPLQQVLDEVLDLESMHACSVIKLFITATHVHTGQPRVFGCDEISVDVLLASACIPFLFQSVQIEGEPYWDGGYVGNPSIWPLIYHTDCRDMLLVQINPLEREGTPTRAVEIINRLNEISFNASLISEMRAIQFVGKLIERGDLSSKDYKQLNMHVIKGDEEMARLGASSKLNADLEFFEHLRALGYEDTTQWLRKHKKDIGKKSTLDFGDFLYKPKRLQAKQGTQKKPA